MIGHIDTYYNYSILYHLARVRVGFAWWWLVVMVVQCDGGGEREREREFV